MFTGLIESVGVVERVVSGAVMDMWIGAALSSELGLGESISCDGACLTVVEQKSASFRVQASIETLRRTTLGEWRQGTRVNLERSLKLSDRLGGHLVLGHVDQVAEIVEKRPEGGSVVMAFALGRALAPLLVEKGSIAVDGISLTVNQVSADRFWVQLIPETQARTALAQKAVGARVNVEGDLIGKYVLRLHALREGGLSAEAVASKGFEPG